MQATSITLRGTWTTLLKKGEGERPASEKTRGQRKKRTEAMRGRVLREKADPLYEKLGISRPTLRKICLYTMERKRRKVLRTTVCYYSRDNKNEGPTEKYNDEDLSRVRARTRCARITQNWRWHRGINT